MREELVPLIRHMVWEALENGTLKPKDVKLLALYREMQQETPKNSKLSKIEFEKQKLQQKNELEEWLKKQQEIETLAKNKPQETGPDAKLKDVSSRGYRRAIDKFQSYPDRYKNILTKMTNHFDELEDPEEVINYVLKQVLHTSTSKNDEELLGFVLKNISKASKNERNSVLKYAIKKHKKALKKMDSSGRIGTFIEQLLNATTYSSEIVKKFKKNVGK